MEKSDKISIATYAWVASIALCGFIIRTASYRNFLNPDGGFWFFSPDPYDHLRRITLGVASFPRVPSFDSYAAYPAGLGQIWSPLFDYILSFLALIFGGGETTIQTIGFFTNPVLSVVTILAIFYVARALYSSDIAGIVAALILAVSPGHITYTLGAKLDHHVLEPLVILILFSFVFMGRERPVSIPIKLLATLSFPLTILMWRGATLFWTILLLYALMRSYIENLRGERNYLHAMTRIFLGGALCIAIICILNPWGSSGGVSYGILSWFHAVLLAGYAGALVLLGTSTSLGSMLKRAGLILLSLAIVSIAPQVRPFAVEIFSGFSFVGGNGDPWLESIAEQKFIFHWGFFKAIVNTITLFWFFIPLAVLLGYREWQDGGKTDVRLMGMIVWLCCMIPLLKLRYICVMAVPVALGVAYLFDRYWKRNQDVRLRSFLTGAVIILILLGYGSYRDNVAFANTPIVQEGELGSNGVFTWIRRNTPSTRDYLDPKTPAEYGVLSPWEYGSKIYYLGHRPSVSTAFGWEAHGLYESCGFFSTVKSEIAYEIARKNSVRYILAALDDNQLSSRIAQSGVKKGKLPPGTTDNYDPAISIYRRLLVGDGASASAYGNFLPALPNYRLVYESPQMPVGKGKYANFYKLFEVVPGALLSGSCSPAKVVSISLNLKTSTGRIFEYSDKTVADAQGKFSFRLPYSTEGGQGGTLPLEKYRIKCQDGADYKVGIQEHAVLTGEKILLPGA